MPDKFTRPPKLKKLYSVAAKLAFDTKRRERLKAISVGLGLLRERLYPTETSTPASTPASAAPDAIL